MGFNAEMRHTMKIIGVIPARYTSSRFPGKPLADICGKPMIWWVYHQAIKVSQFNGDVYIATDDKRIEDVCIKFDMNVIMTNSKHPTGTDRTAEVAEKIKADFYVNIQGDEPLLSDDIIYKVIPYLLEGKAEVTNLMSKIKDPIDFINPTVPKVLVNNENIGVYLTRAGAPYPKGSIDYDIYKQVCVYGFSRNALLFFKNQPRGRLENIEDIEILRFIECGYKVQFIEIENTSIAVDTEKDLEKVKTIITNRLGRCNEN